jgi:hypothetical protein
MKSVIDVYRPGPILCRQNCEMKDCDKNPDFEKMVTMRNAMVGEPNNYEDEPDGYSELDSRQQWVVEDCARSVRTGFCFNAIFVEMRWVEVE